MKLSTRARYGLRAMVELGAHQGAEPLMMRAIAERQNLSKRYLDNIFAVLRQQGLITSVRGAAGGYSLSRPADQITAIEIVEAMEGELMLVHCAENNTCDRIGACVAQELWKEASAALKKTLSAWTLQQLIDRQLALEEAEHS